MLCVCNVIIVVVVIIIGMTRFWRATMPCVYNAFSACDALSIGMHRFYVPVEVACESIGFFTAWMRAVF